MQMTAHSHVTNFNCRLREQLTVWQLFYMVGRENGQTIRDRIPYINRILATHDKDEPKYDDEVGDYNTVLPSAPAVIRQSNGQEANTPGFYLPEMDPANAKPADSDHTI